VVEPNVKDELFDTTIMDEEAVKGFSAPDQQQRPRTWRLYWRRLLKRPAALVGTIVFCFFLFLAVFGPWIAPYDYEKQSADLRLATPTLSHPFGADQFGRDILSRIIVGTRNIFLLGGFGTAVAVVIGTAIGLFAGYIGGTTDEVVMRLLDVLLSFPSLLLALVLLSTVGPSNLNIVFVVAILYVPMVARVVRSMVLDLKNKEFVEAARVRGETRSYVLFREILPNSLPPLLVEASMRFSYSIFLVASLGFLGLGVQPPSPDWGLQINQARAFFAIAPWVLLFPACTIALLVISTNLMSDGLRQVMLPGGGRN
jgi:peptide/nickel transport system permease protein